MRYCKPLLLCTLMIPAMAQAIDLDNGADINETCAGCHGEYGQGGKKGEYPRLAGQPALYLTKQLHLFRSRTRPNLAMVEYVDDRQMPDEDIEDIAHFLEQIKLKTKLPPVDEKAPGFNAYARLLESKRLMQIPRAPGDTAAGEKIYHRECSTCHGRKGEGRADKAVPMLAGQYTSYLWRQVKKYRDGIRIHDEDAPDEKFLSEFSDTELGDVFAYLSTLDD